MPPAGQSTAKAGAPGTGGINPAPSPKASGRFARAMGYFGMDSDSMEDESDYNPFTSMMNSSTSAAPSPQISNKGNDHISKAESLTSTSQADEFLS